MKVNLLQLLSFLITLAAFIYGVIVSSRKDGPLYFRIIISVAVCHLLKESSILISHLCGDPSDNLMAVTLSLISSVFFLLSANFGQLDGFVDGSSVPASVKLSSCVVPLLILCSFAAALAAGLAGNTMHTITDAAVVALMLPASYFNTKHLFMPDDEVGFLKSSRGCNLCALLYYIMIRFQVLVELNKPQFFSDVMRVAVSVSVMILVLAAERGIKRWKILISSFS